MVVTSILLPRPRKVYNIVNARWRRSRTDQSEVRRVLAAYDLGQLKGYRQPAIGPSRSRNLILDIGNGQKVLKQYKPSMRLEGITYEHSVLKHLAVNSFPSPRLVPNREGKTCLEMEGKYYALFDFIPGFSYADYFISVGKKNFFLAEAGKTLARYHQIVDGFVPAGRKLDGLTPDGQKWWQDQDWYLARFTEYETLFKTKDEKSNLDQFILLNIDRLKRCYTDLNQALKENLDSLLKMVIHGDYGPYNLSFDMEGLVAVLDFECVHLDLRAAEIVASLCRFAGREVGLEYDKARIFFKAYSSFCPLTASEIELMPDIFRLRRLRGLVYRFRDYFDWGNPLKLRYARQAIAWIDWMEKNGDDLVEVLLGCQENDKTR